MSLSPKQKPAQYYRVEIKRYPAMSTEDELAMFAAYQKKRTKKRKEEIVRQYLCWAAEVACRYCGPRMSKSDAISAANHGLMLAIEKFNPEEGKRFTSFSYFAIRREVLRALGSSYLVNPEPSVDIARHEYAASDRTPADEQKLKATRAAIYSHVSTSVGCGSADFRDEEPVEIDCRDSVERASLVAALKAHLPKLPKGLRRVVELKYFGKELTFVAIAVKLKCTPDHARWLHSRALKKLQKLLRPVTKEL